MKLPFRADHVGSLLRPESLLEARERWKDEALGPDELRQREDAAIAEAVRKQEAVGLKSVTDGEYRRESFHFDFISRIGGIETNFTIGRAFLQGEKTKAGGEKQAPLTVDVVGRMVRPAEGIEVENFHYLQTQVGPDSTAKVTMPSPTMTKFRVGRDEIDRE
ncbi:MAG: 5-methyltetrahydropteroyltriglutamate--homocysteine S-methyltransferase, partial [Rhodospirillaceae bacterium]|nr:5-methyltetrahydropteroyltriglutamate--homocysteine S-methyltransferase [Rhodospirillaceae bacterium]